MTTIGYQPIYLNGPRFTGTPEEQTRYAGMAAKELLHNRIKLVAANTLIPLGIALAVALTTYGSYAILSAATIETIIPTAMFFLTGPMVIAAVAAASIAGVIFMHDSWSYVNYSSVSQIKFFDNWVRNIDPEHPETLKGVDVTDLHHQKMIDLDLYTNLKCLQDNRDIAQFRKASEFLNAYRTERESSTPSE